MSTNLDSAVPVCGQSVETLEAGIKSRRTLILRALTTEKILPGGKESVLTRIQSHITLDCTVNTLAEEKRYLR
jgi:hypothetical protein